MVVSLPNPASPERESEPKIEEPIPRSGDFPGDEAVFGRMRSENFPVAARLLPRTVRRHLHALYGYFRLVDYAGDEAPGNRGALLDLLEVDLKRVYQGTARIPVLRRLQPTALECAIPFETLAKLIEANRRDQHVRRYETFEDLVDYCTLSANPVGEAVLHVFGRAEPELIGLSNRICTALQILEHCQDISEDLRQGRVYLPVADLKRFGCDEDELSRANASTKTRGLIRFEVARAGRILASGAPLVNRLSGMARLAVAGYVAGGRATTAAFPAARFDPLGNQVRPSKLRTFEEWGRLHMLGGSR